MKNYKTTLVGALIAMSLVAQTMVVDGFHFNLITGTKLITALLIAGLGVVSKDFDKSGK